MIIWHFAQEPTMNAFLIFVYIWFMRSIKTHFNAGKIKHIPFCIVSDVCTMCNMCCTHGQNLGAAHDGITIQYTLERGWYNSAITKAVQIDYTTSKVIYQTYQKCEREKMWMNFTHVNSNIALNPYTGVENWYPTLHAFLYICRRQSIYIQT